jgi:exodeoxyribonuclease-3
MKIISRNVNGLRAVVKNGFLDRFQQEKPDILCLQEVKSFENQIPAEIRFVFSSYQYLWHQGTRPGYAGTAIFYRKEIKIIKSLNQFDEPMFFEDGRTTAIEFEYEGEEIHLVNCYFPNGGPRADGTEMLSYKLDFYHKMDELDYWFEHRTVRVHTKYKNKGKEDVIKYQSLIVEFANI